MSSKASRTVAPSVSTWNQLVTRPRVYAVAVIGRRIGNNAVIPRIYLLER